MSLHKIGIVCWILLYGLVAVVKSDDDVSSSEICGSQGACQWELQNATCCSWNGDRLDYEERQNIPSFGSKRRLEDLLCACEDESSALSGGKFRAGMVVVSIFAMVTLLSVLLWYFSKSMRGTPSNVLAEAELQRMREHELRDRGLTEEQLLTRTKISQAKAALTSVLPPQDSPRCPICLEVMQEGIVRPPDCNHQYHRECIEDWIDRAKVPKKYQRALACPICNIPISTLEGESCRQTLSSRREVSQEIELGDFRTSEVRVSENRVSDEVDQPADLEDMLRNDDQDDIEIGGIHDNEDDDDTLYNDDDRVPSSPQNPALPENTTTAGPISFFRSFFARDAGNRTAVPSSQSPPTAA